MQTQRLTLWAAQLCRSFFCFGFLTHASLLFLLCPSGFGNSLFCRTEIEQSFNLHGIWPIVLGLLLPEISIRISFNGNDTTFPTTSRLYQHVAGIIFLVNVSRLWVRIRAREVLLTNYKCTLAWLFFYWGVIRPFFNQQVIAPWPDYPQFVYLFFNTDYSGIE